MSRGKVLPKAYEESTHFLRIWFEAFLKRFVAPSARHQIPIRFFKFQWVFYYHKNGSETVGEMAQKRSSSLPTVKIEVINKYCELQLL